MTLEKAIKIIARSEWAYLSETNNHELIINIARTYQQFTRGFLDEYELHYYVNQCFILYA